MKKQYYSETSFYTRLGEDGVGANKIVIFETPGGGKVGLTPGYVEKYLENSHEFNSTKKVSRRDMIEAVLTNPKVAMAISFNKKLKALDVAKEALAYFSSTSRPSKTGLSKALSLKGVDRVMVGHHNHTFTEEGRLNFIDIEADGSPVKQVDTRTIYSVIVNKVKYILN